MPKRIPAQPIRTLDELPRTGLVLWADFLSKGEDRRVMPLSEAAWRRHIKSGGAPQARKLLGCNATHAEHIRAILTDRDWRDVKLPGADGEASHETA